MLGSWLVGWGRATSVHWVASLSNTGVEISASSHCKAGRNIMLECKPEITRVQNTGTRCFWNKAGVAARPDNGQVKTGIRSSGDWGHVLPERPWASNPISLSLTFCRGCHFCKMRLLNGIKRQNECERYWDSLCLPTVRLILLPFPDSSPKQAPHTPLLWPLLTPSRPRGDPNGSQWSLVTDSTAILSLWSGATLLCLTFYKVILSILP